MKPCVLCGQEKEETDYSERHGRMKKTCDVCCLKLKARYWEKKNAEVPIGPVPFEALIEAYDLTEEETHAVDIAAGQSISSRRFKRRHKGDGCKWPGPSAEKVLDAIGKTETRRIELLQAASILAREEVSSQGLDPKTFFSSHR